MFDEILPEPGNLHAFLYHLPILDAAVGALTLFIAFIPRSRPAQIAALVVAALMTGCAAVPLPALSTTHPASPEAQEGALPSRRSSLDADDLTNETRAQLAAAAKAQKEWDAHGPVSGTPPDSSGPERINAAPGTDHSK